MATEFPHFRVATAVSFALLALTACSSKNPDTLVGMNLDENAAMMDANATVDANLAGTNGSANAAASEQSATTAADTSRDTAAPKLPAAPKPPVAPKPPRSDQVNAADIDVANRTGLDRTDDNQTESEPDLPNMMQ